MFWKLNLNKKKLVSSDSSSILGVPKWHSIFIFNTMYQMYLLYYSLNIPHGLESWWGNVLSCWSFWIFRISNISFNKFDALMSNISFVWHCCITRHDILSYKNIEAIHPLWPRNVVGYHMIFHDNGSWVLSLFHECKT